jgi:hypothetical protein
VDHVWKFRKNWQSPKICGALVPRGIKSGKMMHTKMKKKSRVLTKKCSVGQDMTRTKQKEKTGLKFKKPDTKTSAGSVVSPG